MPLLGSAAILLSYDIAPEAVEEHDRWHTHEHFPERLTIPGFLRSTRWIAATDAPRYMVLYEVRDASVLNSDAYLARLNQPTSWTQRMMPSFRGMRRGLCSVVGSFGYGLGGSAAMIAFSADEADAAGLRHWLLEDVLPKLPQKPGLGSAHLLQGTQAAAMTNEQRIRGADRGVDWAIIVTGYDADAVTAHAESLCAGDHLPARGARDLASAIYDMGYMLSSAEIAT